MNLFSMDNLFFRTVGKAVDLVWLNILTLVFSIPCITAGAAVTAMYSVLLRLARNEEGHITRNFFSAFRENFKNATKIWIVVAAVIAFYIYDICLLRSGIMDGYAGLKLAVEVGIGLSMLLAMMILNYLFPLLARYENSIRQSIINAVLLAFAYLPRSICMVVIWFFPFALMLLSDYFLYFWFLYGLSFPGFCCAQLLRRIFDKVKAAKEGEEREQTEI